MMARSVTPATIPAHLARATRAASLRTSGYLGRPPLFHRSIACSNARPNFHSPPRCLPVLQSATLSTTARCQLLVPDGQPKEDIEVEKPTQTPANLTDAEYHRLADSYMDTLLAHLERMQDKREDVDVEYSNGVLNVTIGVDGDTYVINKQPPNKQIWLSSPKTGPKRYDYVIFGDGQGDKQDTASGEWVYARDNSTLDELLAAEVGVNLKGPSGHYDS